MYLLIKVKKNPKDKEKFLKILKIISIFGHTVKQLQKQIKLSGLR